MADNVSDDIQDQVNLHAEFDPTLLGDDSTESPSSEAPPEGDTSQEKASDTTPSGGDEDLFDLTKLGDQNEWAVSEKLANYFNANARKFISPKILKERILEDLPIPKNLMKIPELDKAILDVIPKGAYVLTEDKTLKEIWQSVQQIAAPEMHLWQELESLRQLVKATKAESEGIDENPKDDWKTQFDWEDILSQMSKFLQQTVTLHGQALNKINFLRRCNALSGIPNSGGYFQAKTDVKEARELLEKDSTDKLFGDSFINSFKVEAKQVKAISQRYEATAAAKKAQSAAKPSPHKPFQQAQGSGSSTTPMGRGQTQGGQKRQAGWSQGGSTPKRGRGFAFRGKPFASPHLSCSSWGHEALSSKSWGSIPYRRKDQTFPRKLESFDKRPVDSKNSSGVGDSPHPEPLETKNSGEDLLLRRREEGNRPGDTDDARKRSHLSSPTEQEPGGVKHIHQTQEGRETEDHNKPQTIEQTHRVCPFQNGIIETSSKSPSPGRLDGQNRPQGCLLQHTDRGELPGAPVLRLGRETLQVPSSPLRTWPSPSGILKVNESPHIPAEETGDSNHHLPRRHVDSRIIHRGNNNVQRYYDFLIRKPGSSNQLGKIFFDSIAQLRVSRSDNQLPDDVDFSSNNQIEGADSHVQPNEITENHLSENPGKTGRETLSYLPSSFSGPNPNQESSTLSHPSVTPEEMLRRQHSSGQGLHPGVELVDHKLVDHPGETGEHGSSSNDHLNGCINVSLGGSLGRGADNRGSVVSVGAPLSYQCARVTSRGIGSENIPQGKDSGVSSHEHRQHHSSEISDKDGRYQELHSQLHSQKDLGVLVQEGNICDSKLDPLKTKRDSRQEIETQAKFQRMASPTKDFPKNSKEMGETVSGPFRIKIDAPNRSVCQPVPRPRLSSSKCSLPRLVRNVSIPISPFLSDRQSVKETSASQSGQSCSHSPTLARPNLVPLSSGTMHRQPMLTSKMDKPPIRPRGKPSPPDREKISPPVCLSSHRQTIKSSGLSDRATELVLNARRQSSTYTYQTPWRKWGAWCSTRKIDPYRSDIKDLADYLAELFESGLESRTIGVHRSAISAYHLPVEGFKVGEHPLIVKVMAGIRNLRPAKSRYHIIWDVQTVLEYLKSLGDMSSMSLKVLSWKTAMLVSLVALSRCNEIKNLNISRMVIPEAENKVVFFFDEPHKTQDPEKPQGPLEIFQFESDPLLCPVKCIQAYLKQTKELRGQESQFFVKTCKPHSWVTRSTIASWIKRVLKNTGVDVNVFKGHSTRSAASSAARARGASVKDILDRGNWSNKSTWQNFYNKNIVSAGQRFQQAILG